jgi:hypothetical protein
MKKIITIFIVGAVIIVFTAQGTAANTILYQEDFETSWSGDYTPGWQLTGYEWGTTAPTVMAQASDPAGGTNKVLKLTVTGDGDPVGSTSWWGGVEFDDTSYKTLMRKASYPYVSVKYYDTRDGQTQTGNYLPSGCLVSIPISQIHYDAYGDYIYDINLDWTDLQHGTRHGDASADAQNYYHYGSAPDNGGAGWAKSDILRDIGWHEFRMELSPAGVLSYFVDDTLVGTSPRTDYLDLEDFNLYVWRSDGAIDENATVYYDDFEFGQVPEPVTICLLGLGGLSLLRKRK